jgi:hypothetical protein
MLRKICLLFTFILAAQPKIDYTKQLENDGINVISQNNVTTLRFDHSKFFNTGSSNYNQNASLIIETIKQMISVNKFFKMRILEKTNLPHSFTENTEIAKQRVNFLLKEIAKVKGISISWGEVVHTSKYSKNLIEITLVKDAL